MLLTHLVGGAGRCEPDQLSKWRMRPAGTARQCRDQAGDRCVMVTIERAQIDCIYRSAARAPYPQEPMTRGDGGADGRSLLTRKRR
jgi:hypothetical protein